MAGLIRIRAHAPRGYRLAGMRHGPDWSEHPAARFTARQLEALRADPMLEVEIVAPRDGVPAGRGSIPPAPNTEGGSSPHGAAGDDAPGGPGAGRASAPSAPAIPPARPDEAADVARAIEAAIGRLDAGDAALWTRDGRPQVTAIEAVLGWGISAGERDAVWATLQVAGGLQRPEAG